MESTLTSYQDKLIKELSAEFKKLNPTEQKVGSGNKFTLNTILACNSEEHNFTQSVRKHNLAMASLLDKELKAQIKVFEKEFGKIAYTQLGYKTRGSEHLYGGYDELLKCAEKNPASYAAQLYIISKVHSGRTGQCERTEGKSNKMVYLSYRTITDTITLASGKQINLYRIVGFNFSEHDNYNRDKGKPEDTGNTLDELIQKNKSVQQCIVALS